MYLTIAVMLLGLAGAVLSQARYAAKHRRRGHIWTNVAVAVLLLIGAGYAARFGILYPTAFLPDPYSNCLWGYGASAYVCAGHPKAPAR
jgi:hypothetical protein